MNNKIEEGCLAMVVGAKILENNGKVGRVGKFLGKYPKLNTPHASVWEFDQKIKYYGVRYGEDQGEHNCVPEEFLMRINPDAKVNLTEEKKNVIVSLN